LGGWFLQGQPLKTNQLDSFDMLVADLICLLVS